MTDRPVGAEALAQYQKDVDQALSTLCGVTYSTVVDEMAPGMDGGGAMLRAGVARGISPADFARVFQRAHKLALCETSGRPWAESFNLSRAAIVGFGTESRGWRVGTDGRAYLAVEGGQALRLDIGNREGKWGFAVSESVGPAPLVPDGNDPLRRIAPPEGKFTKLAARLDVGDAIGDAMRQRALRRATGAAPDAPEAAEPVSGAMRMG